MMEIIQNSFITRKKQRLGNNCGWEMSKLLIEEGYKKNERIKFLSELCRNQVKK